MILDDEQKKIFEAIVTYCKEYSDLIPLSFVLGFYVSIVMTRWWNQYMVIPWPDSIAVFVSATIHGNDERGRLMRRTIVRYLPLSVTTNKRVTTIFEVYFEGSLAYSITFARMFHFFSDTYASV